MTQTRRAPSYWHRDRIERDASIEAIRKAHAGHQPGECNFCHPSPEYRARLAAEKAARLAGRAAYPEYSHPDPDPEPVRGTGKGLRPLPMSEEPDGLEIAAEFLRSYSGTWAFMLTLKAEQSRGQLRYTPRVIEVILNCKAREEKWAAERAVTSEAIKTAPVVAQLPEGRRYYAVENEAGELTFLRITTTKPTERFPNPMTFVDQVIGGGTDWTPRAEPRGRVTSTGSYLGTFASLYQKVVADPEAAMAAYGLAIGKCGYCNRTLTDAESRERGIGPVCAAKAGF